MWISAIKMAIQIYDIDEGMMLISDSWSGLLPPGEIDGIPLRIGAGKGMTDWEAAREFPEARRAVLALVAMRKEEIRSAAAMDARIRLIVARECSHSSPKKAIADMLSAIYSKAPKAALEADLRRLERILMAMERRGGAAEESIARAKAVPISSFIEFGRDGKATSAFSPGERTPSMHYYPKSNRVHCFASGRDEDSIGAMMEIRGCGFMEAVRILCDMA